MPTWVKKCSASRGDSRSTFARVRAPFGQCLTCCLTCFYFWTGPVVRGETSPRTICRALFRDMEKPPQNGFVTLFGDAGGSYLYFSGRCHCGAMSLRARIDLSATHTTWVQTSLNSARPLTPTLAETDRDLVEAKATFHAPSNAKHDASLFVHAGLLSWRGSESRGTGRRKGSS